MLILILVSWGGVVTTMEAGLAVPDWPSSFGSLDPFTTGYNDPDNPDVRWWNVPDILAEHGHRLLGALVGLWIVGLALWTWIADPRKWMHWLAVTAVGLVILEGILGGLRVVWVSIDLAVVHAMVAQLVFSTATALTLFTSRKWIESHPLIPPAPLSKSIASPANQVADPVLRRLAVLTAIAVFVQILLGALLRHQGSGVDLAFILVHVTGSVIVFSLILATSIRIRTYFASNLMLSRGGWIMIACLIAQVILGMFVLMIILYDASHAQRSLAQIIFASTHLAVGTILMASVVAVMLCSLRPGIATA